VRGTVFLSADEAGAGSPQLQARLVRVLPESERLAMRIIPPLGNVVQVGAAGRRRRHTSEGSDGKATPTDDCTQARDNFILPVSALITTSHGA